MTALTLYPAIDLKGGQVVRLRQGEMASATAFSADPGAQAAQFAAAGCRVIHVVDLDGAFAGASRNADSVQAIIAAARAHGAGVQLGGGIRDMAAIETWLARGVSRVILGSAAVRDPALVAQAARAHPGRIVIGIDARDGMVAINGWAEDSRIEAVALARQMAAHDIAGIIFTDVARDGMGAGINIPATIALAASCAVPVIASGGIGGAGDLSALARAAAALAPPARLDGVIVGRALYDGSVDIAGAKAALAA